MRLHGSVTRRHFLTQLKNLAGDVGKICKSNANKRKSKNLGQPGGLGPRKLLARLNGRSQGSEGEQGRTRMKQWVFAGGVSHCIYEAGRQTIDLGSFLRSRQPTLTMTRTLKGEGGNDEI